MTDHPAILDNAQLGLTESVFQGKSVTDHRTSQGYPYMEPRENAPHDDANRYNHAVKKIDQDIATLFLADLLDMPAYLIR